MEKDDNPSSDDSNQWDSFFCHLVFFAVLHADDNDHIDDIGEVGDVDDYEDHDDSDGDDDDDNNQDDHLCMLGISGARAVFLITHICPAGIALAGHLKNIPHCIFFIVNVLLIV